PRIVGLLPETQYELDIREAHRFACALKPRVRVMVRPSFLPVDMIVNDISTKGVGLLCEAPVELGSSLALLWQYGDAENWSTVRARVVRLSPRRDGGWVAGCVFERQLRNTQLTEFLKCPMLAPLIDPDRLA